MVKNSKHLLAIGILTLIFFILIFASTSQYGVDIEYNFNDVEITYLSNNDNNLLLGEVKVKNSGFIPKRVFLDQYVVCQLSDYFGDETYTVEYRGNSHKEYINIFDGPYSYLSYTELSAKDEVILEIVPQFYRYDMENLIERYDLDGKVLPFYIFKVDKTNSYKFDYCSSVKKEEAYKTINIKFNLGKKDLLKDEAIKTY